MNSSLNVPIALSIAGSDCSGGAGIQADTKTFQHFNVHGLTAVTSIVAETPHEVRQLEHVAIPLLQDQINILLETYPINAIKIGLLPSRRCVIAVIESLKRSEIPLIVDPVMIASTGTALSSRDASTTFCDRLLPLATLVTPNIPEAEFILNKKIRTKSDMEIAAQEIALKYNIACLIKGGHLQTEETIIDILWHNGFCHQYSHVKIPLLDCTKGIHGTGCTLSSAITAGIALGQPLEAATQHGIDFVQQLIESSHTWSHNGRDIQCLGW
ncbi:MAG: bifunctional hydroxymethylpyrimidine kinase/phosphomethylpyrimidine kinase [Akkermansiaceae bacterium]